MSSSYHLLPLVRQLAADPVRSGDEAGFAVGVGIGGTNAFFAAIFLASKSTYRCGAQNGFTFGPPGVATGSMDMPRTFVMSEPAACSTAVCVRPLAIALEHGSSHG